MILDTIDKFSQMEALPDFAGLLAEETQVKNKFLPPKFSVNLTATFWDAEFCRFFYFYMP